MKKVAIVGGGISALSVGIYLKKAGFETHIFEKNERLGGLCFSKENEGFVFEPPIRGLKGSLKSNEMYELWEEIGAIEKDTRFIRLSKFYTVTVNGKKVTFYRDIQRTVNELVSSFPEDEKEICRLLQAVRDTGAEKVNVKKPIDMINQFELMAGGFSVGSQGRAMGGYGNISISDLAGLFKSEELQFAITTYFPMEAKASEFICAYANFVAGNMEIVEGGFSKMVDRVAKKYEALGGIIHLNEEVSGVLMDKKKINAITLKSGENFVADYFVFTTSPYFTFKRLLSEKNMQKDMEKAFKKSDIYKVESAFNICIRLDCELEEMASNGCFEVAPVKVAADFRTRVSFRCFDYDKSFAKEGESSAIISVIQDEEDYAYWNQLSVDFDSLKKEAMETAKNVVERMEAVCPALKGHIKILETITPVEYNEKYNAYLGAFRSFVLTKHAGNYSVSGKLKGIDNGFLAGQWLERADGLRSAVISGKFAAVRVKKAAGIK